MFGKILFLKNENYSVKSYLFKELWIVWLRSFQHKLVKEFLINVTYYIYVF